MERFPLSWPAGWPRWPASKRTRATFGRTERQHNDHGGWDRKVDLTISDGVSRVLDELRMLGVREGDSIISTNLQTRLDGLPRSGQAMPADPGVAVYWERAGNPGTKVMAIDRYDRVQDNLAAIAATLAAMRAIERHGGAQILDRAFTGFAALPAPGQTTRTWRDVLEMDALVSELGRVPSMDDIKRQYRRLAILRHPDRGGSADGMAELNLALQRAEEQLT